MHRASGSNTSIDEWMGGSKMSDYMIVSDYFDPHPSEKCKTCEYSRDCRQEEWEECKK